MTLDSLIKSQSPVLHLAKGIKTPAQNNSENDEHKDVFGKRYFNMLR